MSTPIVSISKIDDLDTAYNGSFYFIAGVGGSLTEWTEGYANYLREEDIGTPFEWFTTTGAAVNQYAMTGGYDIAERDMFPLDLTCLMFPLDNLQVARLSMFKLRMQDRWFDDVIDNMRRR